MENGGNKLPKYCRKCGLKLILKKGEPFFDTQTGEKVVSVKVFCPEKDTDTFLKKNNIPFNSTEPLESLNDEQKALVEEFHAGNRGHTERQVRVLVQDTN
jgi:hypothetical protein